MKQTIYLVHHDEIWDCSDYSELTIAFKNEDDAIKEVKRIADKVRADWANEYIKQTNDSFFACREGEYCCYHCEIYIQATELL